MHHVFILFAVACKAVYLVSSRHAQNEPHVAVAALTQPFPAPTPFLPLTCHFTTQRCITIMSAIAFMQVQATRLACEQRVAI